MKIRALSLVLCVVMIITSLVFVSCKNVNEDEKEINISVLNGTTGFGIAKLMDDVKNDKSSLSNVNFTVETDAANITAGLINGSIDIAALPTNAAANLYNKTVGKIKIAAVNTLGVLYVVVNTENVNYGAGIIDFEFLKGKTVYCPAQNPAFIFTALCEANGLEVGKDVIIDTAYAQPADLRSAIVSGKVEIAVLPEPMVTIAKNANQSINTVMDLTSEWDKVFDEGSLMQGCIVVRTEWLENNQETFDKFMSEYKASIEFVNTNADEAAAMISTHKIFENKVVAQKAIPNCNIKYVDGDEMAAGLDKLFSVLYSVAPASIGNKLPDSGIYYKNEK